MEFRLLGPIEVWVAGHRVCLGDRKQRLILAILLLEAGQLVPIERMVALVWSDRPPPSARRTVQAHLSRLRTMLTQSGGEQYGVVLVRRGDCYQLSCDRERIDAHELRRLLELARQAGDDPTRAALLDQALKLWRGPVLADAGTQENRDRLGGGLQALRLAAVEERAEAHLRLGHHHLIVDELSDLAALYPYRQRMTAALMHAHYAVGDTATALEVYRRARQRFTEELGLEPSAELQQLHAAILRGVPAPQLPLPGAAERSSILL
jgi:DNA-binding SARP family transcriptional activator